MRRTNAMFPRKGCFHAAPCVLGVLFAAVAVAAGADQPQWGRAWSRNMVSGEKGLPESFDPKTGRNIRWTAELGTETIAGGLVFVGDSGKRIYCMDAATGRPFWTHDVKDEVWSSPLVADGKVYCATRRGESGAAP